MNEVLPEITDDECYCLMLGARRKYLHDGDDYCMNGTDMIRRYILKRHDAGVLVNVLTEWDSHDYTDKNGKVLPDYAFTVFLTVNPRSNRLAAKQTVNDITDRMFHYSQISLESLVKTNLHKSPSRKPYMDFDVDISNIHEAYREEVLDDLREKMGDTPLVEIKTQGGYHVLIKKDEIDKSVAKTFYKDVTGMKFEGEIEVKSDSMVPLPGCCCGGYVVNIL